MRRHRESLIAAALMLALLAIMAAIWFPLLPNELGKTTADYGFWLPNLLAGYFWYLHNGIFSLPWFSPAECAGIPFQADPQIGYLSVPQFLAFITDPLSAARASWIVYGAAGFWGAWRLARRDFALSQPAALLTASLFLLNGFFSTRMAVGHLTFAPFMLLPAFCATLLRPPASRLASRPALVLRACLCGLLLAVSIQAGMAVVLPQFYLAVLATLLLHATRFGWQPRAALTLAAGTALGLALCAGKLAAGAALLANFPRELYPLPGLPGPLAVVYIALRSLFWPVSNDLRDWIVNSRLIQEQHEFAYGVGLAPPLLMLAAGATAWRRQGWHGLVPARRAPALALALVLLVPLALNLYAPGWNGLLKSLPILGSSSTLLRWFTVFILPAILGAALATDAIAQARPARAWPLAGAGLALTIAGLAVMDKSAMGSGGQGIYNPDEIVQAWQHAHDTGAPPPVTQIVELFGPGHQILMSPDRQNGLAHGYSTASCYDPLFGYRLEKLPYGELRLARAMSDMDGILNIKNPACYVYPAANQCHPGDQFTTAQSADAEKFLNYEPFPYQQPLSAKLASWLSLLSLLALPFVAGAAWWRHRRP
jgi:hypothetical protein